MNDKTKKLEEILAGYIGQPMTAELRAVIVKEMLPHLGTFADHIETSGNVNPVTGAIDLVMKPKTAIGKILLDKIADGTNNRNKNNASH